ncbi:hypothetical protein ACFSM5_09160 [Lacibacterium aquatile]|uniref:Uncharacterized protein n=1 Tax=Lacibacterium aquatile TaxID=1168082 RepID=A0ABW5DT81_9PROT
MDHSEGSACCFLDDRGFSSRKHSSCSAFKKTHAQYVSMKAN